MGLIYKANASGTWTTATWDIGGIPAEGDQIQIAAGVEVTVDDERTIGTSPAGTDTTLWAVDLLTSAAAGSAGDSYLTIAATGALNVRGPSLVQNTASRTINARRITVRGTWRFNGGKAADPATASYRLQLGTAAWNYARLYVDGGVVTSSKADEGFGVPANGYLSQGTGNNGTPVELVNASVSYVNDGSDRVLIVPGSSNAASMMSLDRVSFSNCGQISGTAGALGTYLLRRVTILDPLISTSINVGLAAATWTIDELRNEGRSTFTGSGLNTTLSDSMFYGGFTASSLSVGMIDGGGNVFYETTSAAGGNMMNCYSATMNAPLLVIGRLMNNPKILHGNANFSTTVIDPIFEDLSPGGVVGEFIPHASVEAGRTLTVYGAIFNSAHDGRSQKWVETTSGTTKGVVRLIHCSGTGSHSGQITYGHNLGEPSGEERISMENCLAVIAHPTDVTQASRPYSYSGTDNILDARVHHNCFGVLPGSAGSWQMTGTITITSGTVPVRSGFAGTNGGLTPYFHEVTAPDPNLGRYDLHVNPFSTDIAPKLDDWAQTLGSIVGATTAEREDEVMLAWLVADLDGTHPNFPAHAGVRAGCTPALYRTFCEAAWTPDHPALVDSSDTSLPHPTRTLTTMGAMEVEVAASGGGRARARRRRVIAAAA